MTTAIEVRAPYDARELARLQAEAEADAIALVDVTCPDAPTYTALDGILTEVLKRADAVEATRQSVTRPLLEAKKAADRLFAPLLGSLGACENVLKRAMGGYLTAKAAAEKEARALALTAAKAGDDVTMAQALTVAEAVGAAPEASAKGRFAWVVKRIIPELLTPEYLCPDMAKIEGAARGWPGSCEDPPVVPGVVFERVARIAGSHK